MQKPRIVRGATKTTKATKKIKKSPDQVFVESVNRLFPRWEQRRLSKRRVAARA